jgi:hypothetical protein
MRKPREISVLLFIAVLWGFPFVSFGQTPKSYKNIRELVSKISNHNVTNDKLARLFRVGDKQIAELLKLLNDPNPKISLGSQVVLRYLGNEEGMRGLFEWYHKQKHFQVSGPVPLPLSDWDYKVIDAQYVKEPPQKWSRIEPYIYALALENSAKSKNVLRELIKNAGNLDDSTTAVQAIKNVQSNRFVKAFKAEKDLSKMVLNNAFFVSTEDRKYTTARLLSQNDAKDKALVEIYINRGALSEEWYHVVINKTEKGWNFLSITPVAVS